MLHREAGPKADSLLRRKFVDGILDMELQRHLRVHAAKDDVATTVSKARQFLVASELTRTVKKPAIRATSPSVNYQSNLDGLMEALDQRIQPRRLTPTIGVRRPHLARDRRHRVTHLQGALPAVRHPPAGLSDSRIRRMPDPVTRPTARLSVAVGRAVSLHRAMAMAPGHEVIVVSHGKLLLDHSPRDPTGYNAKVVRHSRRHSQEGHGHRGKAVHVSVPQRRAIQVIGGPDGHDRGVLSFSSRLWW